MSKIFEETILIIKKIYKTYPTGGALHIVLDDGNTESHHIIWCLENSIPNITKAKDKKLFESCANNLLRMTERQRDKCITQAFRT